MTKAELIDLLKQYPDDLEIMVSTWDSNKVDPSGVFSIKLIRFEDRLSKDCVLIDIDE